jgi:hypothetical protein
MIGLALFTVALAGICWGLVRHARRRYGSSLPTAPGVDYLRPAPWRELIPALIHAGVLEVTVVCAAFVVVSGLALLLRLVG